jgi:hypothetical protein
MATSVRGGGFVLPPAAAGRSFSSQSRLLSNRLLLLPKIGPACAPRLCKLRSSSPFAVGMENQTLNLPRYFIFLFLFLWKRAGGGFDGEEFFLGRSSRCLQA